MAVQTLPAADRVPTDWRPAAEGFWSSRGKAIAPCNLWLSLPAFLLACVVWMVWSAVLLNLPRGGFAHGPDQSMDAPS